MRLTISEECIACGLCSSLYPSLFKMNQDETSAEVIADPSNSEEEEQANDAASVCPAEAINVSA